MDRSTPSTGLMRDVPGGSAFWPDLCSRGCDCKIFVHTHCKLQLPPHSLFASDAYDDTEKILAGLKSEALEEGDSLACPKPPVLLFGVSFTRIFSTT